MRRTALRAALLLFVLGVPVFSFAGRGGIRDKIFSALVSGRYSFPASFRNVRVESLTRISFDSLRARWFSGIGEIRTGRGSMETDPLFFMTRSAVVRVNGVQFEIDAERRFFSFLGASPDAVVPLVLKRFEIKLYKKGRQVSWRILKMEAEDFSVKGGLEFEGGRLQKADLILTLDEKLLRHLPRGSVSRMRAAEKGRRRFQILFSGNTLTVRGRFGPWLKANWQGQA